MKNYQRNICCAVALALSSGLYNSSAQAQSPTPVQAIPQTDFSSPSSISLFRINATDRYKPKQLTLQAGGAANGVADFVESPAYVINAQTQPPHNCQIVADGSTSYTKIIPFDKQFDLHFQVAIVGPSMGNSGASAGPSGGTVFELHDTDVASAQPGNILSLLKNLIRLDSWWCPPAFAQAPPPAVRKSAIRLDETNGRYTFYANDKAIWNGNYTLKSFETFELSGVLQPNTPIASPVIGLSKTLTNADSWLCPPAFAQAPPPPPPPSYGRLVLKRNGVVVATYNGPNTHGTAGQPAHPLTCGPHVRLGLGNVPPSGPGLPPITSQVYIDNVHAIYWP